jgi:hypothetical protein
MDRSFSAMHFHKSVAVLIRVLSFILQCSQNISRNREFVMQPFKPSDGYLVLHKLMANGSNGFDACLYF